MRVLSECTGYTGSQRHKGDGINGILKEDEATKVASHISNDGSHKTNHQDGRDKC